MDSGARTYIVENDKVADMIGGIESSSGVGHCV